MSSDTFCIAKNGTGWASVVLGVLVFCSVASADEPIGDNAGNDRVGYTTFLREGPGTNYRPIDEALSGRRVEIVNCNNGWCEVRYGGASGYLAQGTLVAGANSSAPAVNDPRCFETRQSGYRDGRGVRFCYGQPASQ